MRSVFLVFSVVLLVGAHPPPVRRSDFPEDFVFGSATASYQIEGAYNEDGRGLTIWDTFSHTPGKTANGDTGDVADDHYHRVAEDIALMKAAGLKNYRLSFAWSRIMPTGGFPINQQGVDHYNNEINSLLSAGIQPYVTLFHWDLPQLLEDINKGWLNETTVEAFKTYADTCFSLFGDRVKHWITINEPHTVAILGYDTGAHAPGRCSNRAQCPEGDSSTEPYIAAYNLLNGHAAAGNLYLEKYQKVQKGHITMTLDSPWVEPQDPNNPHDVSAAQRAMDFNLGWFADPLYFGDWPQSMKDNVGDRLPQFTPKQSYLLTHSHDFFGLNHYTSQYGTSLDPDATPPEYPDYFWDMQVNVTQYAANGSLIGEAADSDWLFVVPWGFQKLLAYVYNRYGAPIVVTENGCDVPGENELPIKEALLDTFRVKYLNDYLYYASRAIVEDNVDLVGYFLWSFMDNFEWADGYTKRFGVHYVDYDNNITRYTKASADWYRQLIRPEKE